MHTRMIKVTKLLIYKITSPYLRVPLVIYMVYDSVDLRVVFIPVSHSIRYTVSSGTYVLWNIRFRACIWYPFGWILRYVKSKRNDGLYGVLHRYTWYPSKPNCLCSSAALNLYSGYVTSTMLEHREKERKILSRDAMSFAFDTESRSFCNKRLHDTGIIDTSFFYTRS